MDDDKRTGQLVGAILAGLLFITGAIFQTGAAIATAVNKEASGEFSGIKWYGMAFLLFGLIVLILSLGKRRS